MKISSTLVLLLIYIPTALDSNIAKEITVNKIVFNRLKAAVIVRRHWLVVKSILKNIYSN